MLYPAELRARIAFRRGGGDSPDDPGTQAPFDADHAKFVEKASRPLTREAAIPSWENDLGRAGIATARSSFP
jgi:hypothetical protein